MAASSAGNFIFCVRRDVEDLSGCAGGCQSWSGDTFRIVLLRKRGLRVAQAADEGSMYLGWKSSASLAGDTAECTDPSSESCAPRRTRFLRMTDRREVQREALHSSR